MGLTMSELTQKETDLLRRTLGLTKSRPDKHERNYIIGAFDDEIPVLQQLVARGYMLVMRVKGQSVETYYKATKDGFEAVKLKPWS